MLTSHCAHGAVFDQSLDDELEGVPMNFSEIQACIDAKAAAGGGTCRMVLDSDIVLLAQLVVKSNVTLEYSGKHKLLSPPGLTEAIVLQADATMRGVNLHKQGVTFTQGTLAGFSGVGVRIQGHDATVEDCFITGFDQCIRSEGYGRLGVYRNRMDGKNGVWLTNSYDVSRIVDNHCWPFVTMAWAGANDQNPPVSANRPGVGYKLDGVNDWTMLRGNFSYAYAIGYEVLDGSDVTLVQCGADGSQGTSNNTGFYIHGSSRITTLTSCQCAGNLVGFWINNPGGVVQGTGNSAWGLGSDALRTTSGDTSRLQVLAA